MKQHEAFKLALRAPVKNSSAKMVLMALVGNSGTGLDWETWSKPISISYIYNMFAGTLSSSTISRSISALVRLELISREDTGRSDKVKTIKLNTHKLKELSQITEAPQEEPLPQNEPIPQNGSIPQVDIVALPQNESIPQNEPLPQNGSIPQVDIVALPQNDIRVPSKRHSDSLKMTDNKVSSSILKSNKESLFMSEKPSQGSTFQFSNEGDDLEIPDDVNSQQTNDRIKDYFKKPSEPVQPVMSIQEERRARELKIMEAQDRMSRSYRKR